ncbi:MAG: hypothetical protein GY795_07860 [Desulfobacterales bacterium]|nr:hypothetical protein [Desulfobacterales bacterium]
MFDFVFTPVGVIVIICSYMAFLFCIATWVEKKTEQGTSLVNNPLIYSLSLAIYCTAWTFYGSVGSAANTGMLFVTVYLGPTMMIIFSWIILRKLIVIKLNNRLNSIADFISARYDRSEVIAAIISLFLIIGIAPYIALQLKAIFDTFALISGGQQSMYVNMIIVILLIIFTIMFGVRRLDPTERHQGIIAAVAIESIIKLAAFVLVGIYLVYYINEGVGDIFAQVANNNRVHDIVKANQPSYTMWMTYLVLSMSAIIFLPRQFHVSVVECSTEKHVLTSMWLFPVYIFLINIFVYPIAMCGLLKYPAANVAADTFVLRLPLDYGNKGMALFVFIGGFSAATSMIIVSSMALSTMFTNHLLMPVITRVKKLDFMTSYLLQCRWVAVSICILIGYLVAVKLGGSYILVKIGMLSFAAVFQLVPSIIGGIFWIKGNRHGAILGLAGGFISWFYTLILPALIRSEWLISETVLNVGPWGISFLRPENLFGMQGLESLPHGVFWSFLANLILYIGGSLFFKQSEEEQRIAEEFVNVLHKKQTQVEQEEEQDREELIDLYGKTHEINKVLSQYLSKQRIDETIKRCYRDLRIDDKTHINIFELSNIANETEKTLAGSIGAASAKLVINKSMLLTPEEKQRLLEISTKIVDKFKTS